MNPTDQSIRQNIAVVFLLPVGLLVFAAGALNAGYLTLASCMFVASGFFTGFLALAWFSMGVKTDD